MAGATAEAPLQVALERVTDTETASSSRRARELYKYFAPPGSAFRTTKSTHPDTVLTAHAQLVAWRLNCQRAMVSLIDRETQYFVAESTKTLMLDDSSQHEDPSDAIWAGCIAVPKSGRLCEHTIQTMPTPTSPAYFEVLDLTKDERFNTLPFVTDGPFFKYYCGVPLFTKNGVPIGSLFALDDKVREPISQTNKLFMATMADNVMSHYENMKEKEDRKRVLNMNMCLAAFVDPEHMSSRKRKREQSRPASAKPRGKRSPSGPSLEPTESTEVLKGAGRKAKSGSSPSHNSSGPVSDDSDDASEPRVEEDDHIQTFKRASDLLHSSLHLHQGGGVVFFDTATSYGSTHHLRNSDGSSGADSESEKRFSRQDSISEATLQSSNSWGPTRTAENPDGPPRPANECEVLAETSTPDIPRFVPPSHEDLSRLIKRHPRGHLFNLDPDGVNSSSSSDEFTSYPIPTSKKITPTKRETSLLVKHFPGAKQAIFLPLWDPTSSRYSAFFAYSTTEFRTLANNPDLLYCIAFCSCIMTEISRLATLAADQQKSDFIGSVSHELRSPLHGILASCEFLGDTETTSFQKSLVDTADSCARTLLDTINMVLDYSKINAFERSASKARKKGRTLQSSLQDSSGKPQLNIYGDVNLASITEEVVEGVATGQIFKDNLNSFNDLDTSDIPDSSGHTFSVRNEVEIIIDIVPRARARDWVFVTQPGAFRRIIMNIFGNALKYTRKGHIRVRLEAVESDTRNNEIQDAEKSTPAPVTNVKLTISDTGQGMSAQFMRTKLYTPFAQENSIAPGTGLGLSLVKSMVTMLNGEISISSTLGQGTTVMVQFPMSASSSTSSNPATSGSTSGSTPTSAGSIERVKDDSLAVVQQNTRGHRAMLFADTEADSSRVASGLLQKSIFRYLSGWFGFQLVRPWNRNATSSDVIIVDEQDIPVLIESLPQAINSPQGPMIIVMCAASSRRSQNKVPKAINVEAVSYPFGPYKLAKCIRLCFERMERSSVIETEAEIQDNSAREEPGMDSGVEDVISAVEQITISNPGNPDINVLKSGEVIAHEDSIHAGLVSSGTTSSGGSQEKAEYPFPFEDGTVSPSNLNVPEDQRPSLATRRTISATLDEVAHHHPPVEATPTSSKGVIATSPSEQAQSGHRTPRLLLVDDNKVNLRLLQTFMKKRKYTDIFSAEDGQQAVSVFRDLLLATPPRPPDIIFLDISMPVMNGFEAARRIRAIELDYRDRASNPLETPASSLIIALTGLASGRDQSEAFTSGFDLYLVKPISFREVGRLLDNWERNGGAATVGVPHGAAVAGGGDGSGDVAEAP